MRKSLCTLLYRLRLHRLAYYVSPSVYWYLRGKEVWDAMLEGLETTAAAIRKEKQHENHQAQF
jgi:hypothetical protein